MRRIALLLIIAGLASSCGQAPDRRVIPGGEAPRTTPAPTVKAHASVPPGDSFVSVETFPLAPKLRDLTELNPSVHGVPEAACEQGEVRPMRSDSTAHAATAIWPTVARSDPGGAILGRFERKNVNGYPTVFGVLAAVLGDDCRPEWYRVQLPVRPNESFGYVRAEHVEISAVDTRIEIDLSERRLEFYVAGRLELSTRAAIGSAITPTPTGSYYVNQRLTTSEPWGPFGPAAIGISAFSPVLQDWVQGGPIAIHGTNQPDTVGEAVSHGCLRLENETLEWLFERTPAGTPVEIRA